MLNNGFNACWFPNWDTSLICPGISGRKNIISETLFDIENIHLNG